MCRLKASSLCFGCWGGVALLWNALLFSKRERLARRLWAMPVVWGWLPLILFSIVRSLFQPAPLMGWVGSPQLAEGILTFISFMSLSPPLILLTKIKNLRPWVFSGFMLSATGLAALTVLGAFDSPLKMLAFFKWAPVFFSDFMGFLPIAFLPVAWHYRDLFKKPATRYGYAIGCIAFILFTTYYAQNRTLYPAYAIGGFTYLALCLPIFPKMDFTKRFALYLFAGLTFLSIVISFYDTLSSYLPDYFSDTLIFATLKSRMNLAKMTFLDLLYRPWDLSFWADILFGHGWGGYNNGVLSNMFLMNELSLFTQTKWAPTWEFVNRDLLHSHNLLIETFHAIGILGLGCFLFGKYFMLRALNPSGRFIGVLFMVSLCILLTFWFQLPQTFPYTLFATLLVFSSPRSPQPTGRICHYLPHNLPVKPLKTTLMTAGALMLCFSLTHGIYAYRLGTTLFPQEGQKIADKTRELIETDITAYDKHLGGYRTLHLSKIYVGIIFDILEKKEKTDVENTLNMVTTLARFGAEDRLGSNLSAILFRVNQFNDLATKTKTSKVLLANKELLQEWDTAVDHALEYLPFRSDILIPYLSHLTLHKRWDRLDHVLKGITSHKEDDIIAHWFQGMRFMNQDRTYPKGLMMLKEALRGGITRFMPIPPQEVNKILSAPVPNLGWSL